VGAWSSFDPKIPCYLRPLLTNMMIDLSSTSGMTFLLLQKHWMNLRRDSPSFCTMLARSYSTPDHSQVALKLLMSYLQRSDHDHTKPVCSPISKVLAEDDMHIGRELAMTYESPSIASTSRRYTSSHSAGLVDPSYLLIVDDFKLGGQITFRRSREKA
jgi:hypothetical protein